MPGLLRRKFKLILLILVLAFVLTAGYQAGLALTSPNVTADKYFKALRSKEYRVAYSYLKPQKSYTLGLNGYINWQKYEEKLQGPLYFYAVNKTVKGSEKATVYVKVQREKEPDKADYKITLRKSGRVYLIFPKWSIELPEKHKEYPLGTEGAGFYLDEQNTGMLTKGTEPFGFDTYEGKHIYEFRIPNTKPASVVIEEAMPRLEPSDEVMDAIRKSTANEISNDIINAFNTGDDNALKVMLGEKLYIDYKGIEKSEKQYFTSLTSALDKPYINSTQVLSSTQIRVDIWFAYQGNRVDPYYGYPAIFALHGMNFELKDGKWILDKNQDT